MPYRPWTEYEDQLIMDMFDSNKKRKTGGFKMDQFAKLVGRTEDECTWRIFHKMIPMCPDEDSKKLFLNPKQIEELLDMYYTQKKLFYKIMEIRDSPNRISARLLLKEEPKVELEEPSFSLPRPADYEIVDYLDVIDRRYRYSRFPENQNVVAWLEEYAQRVPLNCIQNMRQIVHDSLALVMAKSYYYEVMNHDFITYKTSGRKDAKLKPILEHKFRIETNRYNN